MAHPCLASVNDACTRQFLPLALLLCRTGLWLSLSQKHVTILPFPEGYAHRDRMVGAIIIIIITNSLRHLSSLFSRCLPVTIIRRRGGHWRSLSRTQLGYLRGTKCHLSHGISLRRAAGDSIWFAGASCLPHLLPVKGNLSAICTFAL